MEPRIETDGGRIVSPAGRFIQYKVTLESSVAGVSPALRDISISYLPKNQPPKVAFTAPSGGERWAKQQTVRWDASDPDKDSLNYELYLSKDNGVSWQPFPDGAAAKTKSEPKAAADTKPGMAAILNTPEAKATGPASVPPGSGPPSVSAVQAELDKHPDLPAGLRDAILERARKANGDSRSEDNSASRGSAPMPIRETSRSINTKLLPDGQYVVKVVTSDKPSNPGDARTADAISEPFIVCNTPPTVVVLKASLQIRPNRSVSFEGTALQTLIPITAVQYRVDGGEWMAAVSTDGIFDGASESFTVETPALAAGKHSIEVKAFNAANSTSVDKVEVQVK